jgi:hypothetical protein
VTVSGRSGATTPRITAHDLLDGTEDERGPRPARALKFSKKEYLDMPDPTRKPQNNAKSIDRWDNEGGAPSGGDRSARKRPRDANLQKKAVAKKSPKKQAAMAR